MNEIPELATNRGNVTKRLQRKRTRSGISAAILLGWEVTGRLLGLSPAVLPVPSRIAWQIWQEGPRLLDHGIETFYVILGGYSLALAFGTPCGVLLAWLAATRHSGARVLALTARVPLVTFAPLFLIWFGFGPRPKILFTFLLCFSPLAVGAALGLRSVTPEILALVRLMGAGPAGLFFKVQLPSSLPGFFAGLKSASTLAVVGATVAEFVEADTGLGYLMLAGVSRMDVPSLCAALVVLNGIGMTLYGVLSLLERIVIPWNVEPGEV